jgi:glycolate oxidase FAD binding subunit
VGIGELRARLDACGKTSPLVDLPAGGSVGGALAADPFGADWTLDRRLASLVTFRLRARPECERVIAAPVATLEAGLAAFADTHGTLEPAGAALVREGGGFALVFRLLGDERAVERTAELLPGDAVGPETWTRVRDRLVEPPAPGRARVRLAARRSDVGELCRLASAAAGAASLRSVHPLAGSVVLEVDDPELPALSAAAAGAGALFAAERASGAGPAPCDVFGAPPDALALMRAVKARFDPQRVLAPGRFVGGI